MFTVACGESSDEPTAFTACGGTITGMWTFARATLAVPQPDCATGEGNIDGFIAFNDNGRYSLNANVRAWKKTASDASCAFSTADGGFYRTNGGSVCLAGTTTELDAAACDGTAATLSPPLRGAAEYCAGGGRLSLRSSAMLFLPSTAVLELSLR